LRPSPIHEPGTAADRHHDLTRQNPLKAGRSFPSHFMTLREPPSGSKARLWTLLAAFWLWLLLPIAVYYQRKARREAIESDGLYVWPKTILNRPILLWLIVLFGSVALIVLMAASGLYGP
jgi:hypothetical protein